jgi:predicted GNAT superfamily acetyltransferase
VDSDSANTILAESAQGDPQSLRGDGPTLLAFVPNDIVYIRQTDAGKAAAWRRALRDAFLWAFDRGYAVTGMTRGGFYVLTKEV